MAAELSRRLGHLSDADVGRIRNLLIRAGLPAAGPALSAARYVELMSVDKKAQAGQIRFVLLSRLGEAHIRERTPADALAGTLDACTTVG